MSRARHRIAAAAVVVAVALVFADTSVVALALPEIYADLGTSVVGVSWALTTYALVLAVAGIPVALAVRRVPPGVLFRGGLLVFAAASLACGLAPDLPFLLVARGLQGLGAAGLLAGSIPSLTPLVGGAVAARTWWATAGTVGALVGPALGGLVTQLADWRAVFLLQAPAALAAVVASAGRPVTIPPAAPGLAPPAPAPPGARAPARARAAELLADVAFACTFAALVGALFLAVLLLVVVWQWEPLAGALVVSALPVGAALARPVGRFLPGAALAAGGAVLLALGLAGLAFLPAISAWWAGAALAACGAGFGLLTDVLGPLAIPSHAGPGAAVRSSTARHLGLVVGLAIIAPVLADDLFAAAEQAALAGTAVVLDDPAPLERKVPIAWDLSRTLADAPEAEVPDLAPVFAANGAGEDPAVDRLQRELEETIAATVTRGFRPSFLIGAAFALAAGIPALAAALLGRRRATTDARRDGRRRGAAVALGAALVAGGGLLVAERAAGAADFGTTELVEPCTAPIDPFRGDGLDATLQRALLSGLNGAACELGVGREELVVSLDPAGPSFGVQWDAATIEQALVAGVLRVVDDAEARGTLPGWVAGPLRALVRRVPLEWLLERLGR